MIFTNSLIDGFPIILGSFPIQFAMTIAMAISIRVPDKADGEEDENSRYIYNWVMVAHIMGLIC
jgi:hypothetical protein